MESRSKFSRGEKSLVVGAALVLLLVTVLLSLTEGSIFSGRGPASVEAPAVGEITQRSHDGRYRAADDFRWSRALTQQTIHPNDSVFAGPRSTVTVTLKSGDQVHVKENSLVVFEEQRHELLPNFRQGKFRLHFDGNLSVAMRGQTTTLHGARTELELSLEDRRPPRVKVITGTLNLDGGDRGVVVVKQDEEIDLPAEIFADRLAPAPGPSPADSALVAATPPSPKPFLEGGQLGITHVWTVKDLYGIDYDRGIVAKRTAPPRIPVMVPLSWTNRDLHPVVRVQSGPSADLDAEPIDHASDGASAQLWSNEGLNYLRVAGYDQAWSTPITYSVAYQFAPTESGAITAPTKDDLVRAQDLELTASLGQNARGVIFEISAQGSFETSALYWSHDGHLVITTATDGEYYARVRTVTTDEQLTDWSPVRRFTLRTPPLAPPAPLAERPTPLEALPVAEPVAVPMAPVAVDSKFNRADIFSVSGLLTRGQSSVQYAARQRLRSFVGVEFKLTHWFGAGGLEAVLRASVDEAQSRTVLTDARLNYRYRFDVGHDLIVTPVVGLDVHRARGTTMFSPGYDLLRLGLDVRWPISTDWSLEGFAGAGLGVGGTKLVTGQFKVIYRIDRAWSINAGTGLSLFEAGRASAAAGGVLPYREGTGEYRLGLDFTF